MTKLVEKRQAGVHGTRYGRVSVSRRTPIPRLVRTYFILDQCRTELRFSIPMCHYCKILSVLLRFLLN